MFSRLPKEKVYQAGADICVAYKPSDGPGKDMARDILREACTVGKGGLRRDKIEAEFRRLCMCAAYNTIIAVMVCVNNNPGYYDIMLFSENAAKRDVLWESLINCDENPQFHIEVNFNPSSKRRFVALRRELKKTNPSTAAGTIQYLASHYLDDSSLREDVSQFDFSNSVVLAISQKGDTQQRFEM